MTTIQDPNTFNGNPIKRTHIMAKPIGPACNIDCTYCYYLSKQDLLEYKKGCTPKIEEHALENYIKRYIKSHNSAEIIFSWQGGEPTLLGLSYFKTVVDLQQKYCPEEVVIKNDLQTNGILLNDEWCEFLAEHDFLVGLSIDGPEMLHNAHRKNRSGRGTFRQVMKAVELIHKHKVSFATLTCVNNLTSQNPLEVYRFLRDVVKSTQIQFIPIVEQKTFRTDAPQSNTESWKAENQIKQGDKRLIPGNKDSIVESFSVSDIAWGNFLIAVFDEWEKRDIGTVFIQYFEANLASWIGESSQLCTLNPVCGKGLAMEPNGDLYSCDHYVYPEHKVGNIHNDDLDEVSYGGKQQQFGYAKVETLTTECRNCEYVFACYGECPKNRFIKNANGESNHNYLCAGWKKYFAHIDKSMARLARTYGYPVKFGRFNDTRLAKLMGKEQRHVFSVKY
ncbi:anaerobic sulfatase maturase [Vibrio sp. ZSDZ34]|uniref:Anaerobic sulfatase maturase n=1 Tax=Vibrio gelatinilyticus TaxID=2893468 RepID=A0A9X1WB65_9VIBR|nr:anaerobic sulfatase maturase [Vibrio gelatinilyticus]MCJ2376881.1 anaerobic sulfatase maturase [Vibrio gelatinilyticus]